nr:hypothetical protein [Chloroflexia bacterium]
MDATITRQPTTTDAGFSRQAVEALSRQKAEPAWVLEARLAAWDIYEALPMPKRTDEEWRRTDLRALKLDRQIPFAGLERQGAGLDGLLPEGEGGLGSSVQRAGAVVQRDAATVYGQIDPALTAQGVIFADLDTAVREH